MESKDNDSLEPADTAAQGKRRHPGEDSQSFDDGGTIKKKRSQDNEVENEEADEEITSSNFVVKTEKTDEEPTSSVSDTLVKTEKSDEECSNDNIATAAVKIKSEPVDDEPASSTPTVTIKTEPAAAQVSPANSGQSATVSSSLRPSCRFGVRCYRVNPAHRAAEAHPGESDYRRPDFPAPPLGTPNCPFGNSCYRRNPVHFQQYSHPAD
ncbi:aprataxin and PNK-like factor isoform X2 [Drosophila busckii]|nr:aprataxin and PNK-like factor isoform X2 [Drosophila busckii]